MEQLPVWVLPVIAAVVGGGGVGSLLTALITARGSVYKNLNDLVDQLQKNREADSLAITKLSTQVNTVIMELNAEREYATALYIWGMNGAPPPPPTRNSITT